MCPQVGGVNTCFAFHIIMSLNVFVFLCFQVIALLRHSQESMGGAITRVAVATMTEMMSEHKDLSVKYLIKPLVKPLSLITGGVCAWVSVCV